MTYSGPDLWGGNRSHASSRCAPLSLHRMRRPALSERAQHLIVHTASTHSLHVAPRSISRLWASARVARHLQGPHLHEACLVCLRDVPRDEAHALRHLCRCCPPPAQRSTACGSRVSTQRCFPSLLPPFPRHARAALFLSCLSAFSPVPPAASPRAFGVGQRV